MSVFSTPRYQYLPFEFTTTRSILTVAMGSTSEFRSLVAKVICQSLVLFSMIAAFEAVVINGVKFCFNSALLLINTSHALFYSKTMHQIIEIPPPIPPSLTYLNGENQIMNEPLPEFLASEEKTFSRVFEILATSGFALPIHTPFLIKSDQEMQHIHPLQVMGYMLQKDSQQRKHCAIFFDIALVRNFFINSTLKGLKRPIHAGKTANYIVSFAEKVNIDPDTIRRFLFRHPPLLQELVVFILQN